MNLIIGSGLAAMAAAHALVRKGQRVTMIDVGLELPDATQHLVRAARTQDYPFRDPELAALLKGRTVADAAGVPEKRLFGTTLAFDQASLAPGYEPTNTALRQSFARGGLSTIWGGAVLPLAEPMLDGWPVSRGELAPHYRMLHEFLPVAADSDGLDEWFPRFGGESQAAPKSAQATALLARLEANRQALRAKGMTFGAARLAMRADLCRRCGHCLTGCPFGLIYSAADSLSALKTNPAFTYVPNLIVEKVVPVSGGVVVHSRHDRSMEEFRHQGTRVFLAAGVLSSARIVLDSLSAYDTPLTLRDSQYFVFPLVSKDRTEGVRSERLHTLAQVFLELGLDGRKEDLAHVQIYSYNDFLLDSLRRKSGFAWPLVAPWSDLLIERLWVAQAYLPSELSGTVEIRLEKGPAGTMLTARGLAPDTISERCRAVVGRLQGAEPESGLKPIAWLLEIGRPGQGFHIGGSLPMSRTPGRWFTDRLGRLANLPRVHVVDASILPGIPAAPISYTVMANAHRIASEAVES